MSAYSWLSWVAFAWSGAAVAVDSGPSCAPDGVAASQVTALLQQALDDVGDDVAFAARSAAALSSLPCLSEPFPVDATGRLYWVLGLADLSRTDPEAATRSFAAARTHDPDLSVVAPIFPEGNPVRTMMTAMSIDAPELQPLPDPGDASILLDGAPATQRPTGWPTLLQVLDAQGHVNQTWLLRAGQPLPDTQLFMSQVLVESTSALPGSQPRARKPLLYTALASAVAAGASYGFAFATATEYRTNDDLQRQDYEALRGRANGWVMVSAGFGVVAVGTGVGAALSW